ncbi:MAG TPA: type I restriction endonuclease [Flavisolibacter sp.]|nr:type I restriction endonuclease [Flavisolibacter sp.]
MSHSAEYLHSELPAIELFQRLGYQYYDGCVQDERENIAEVILKDRLLSAIARINPWINTANLQKTFDRITGLQGASLMEINQSAWELLRGATFSVKQVVNGKEEFLPVSYIDYQNPENNDFLVVNQLRCHGKTLNSIPDLVVFVNGIPIAVIECKAPGAQNAFDKAYSDLRFYEGNSEKLFYYNQITAGIYGVGGKYGAISSPQAFYSVFITKKGEVPAEVKIEQDKLLYSLFEKHRLLDIIRHFVIFELEEGRTIKKLPRYQQIRATNRTIEKLQKGEGGVVWHTQGSGKSITMAYVTRKLQAPEYGFNNPTVLVLTDRKDLDQQITGTFRAIGFKNVAQASSVKHLDKLLRNDYGSIITTTLQKFQETEEEATTGEEDQTAQEEHENTLIEKSINGGTLTKITKILVEGKWIERDREEIHLEELSSKENLYVLVDEAHRSQYGFLAAFMRSVLPHARFVAFTGTPLSKEDKSTLAEFYGGEYLDVYTIKESVADGATVELLYDEGIAKLDVKKKELDAEFEAKFGNESEEKKALLKQKALKKYQLSKERLTDIARHLLKHFAEKIHRNGHKALLVTDGRHAAIRYKQIIEGLRSEGVHSFETKVVVSIGSPKSDDIAKEYYETLNWNKEYPGDPKPVWVVAPEQIKTVTDDFKLPYGNESEREKSGKKKFDNTAILIVSDMLLTGWDAPIASCLYLDKPLKEHNLLQAIARVNRSGKGKQAGFIMDYYGITEYLIQALEIFGGDIKRSDILKDISEEYPKLEHNHTKLTDFFKSIKLDRNYNREAFLEAALLHIEPLDLRDQFKELLKNFNKSVAIVLPNTRAMKFFSDFKLFNEVRLRARNMFPDDEELRVTKEESQLLQGIIDEHLESQGVQNLLEEPVSIIDRDKFRKEIKNAAPATRELKMRNNLKHVIKVGIGKNPDFYKPLAQRLEEAILAHKEKRITQMELLKVYTDIQDDIAGHQGEGAEKGFITERQQAVYDTMKTIFNEDAEDATRTLFDLINGELGIIGWEDKRMVQKDMENKLTRFLKTKMERSEAKAKAQELIEVLKKNKDA